MFTKFIILVAFILSFCVGCASTQSRVDYVSNEGRPKAIPTCVWNGGCEAFAKVFYPTVKW